MERTWQQIYLETLNQPRFAFFGIRYVDNRFSIATEEAKLHPGFLALCDLDFYGDPVELEVVDDDLLWVFSVDVHQRTVQYRQSDLRQIRDCVSAGSVRLRMSGLKSRAHLIRKYTHPPDLISASLFTLANLYVQKGFAQQDVFSALRA